MFEEVSPQFTFADKEKQTLEFWRENDIFQKSMEGRKDAPPFVFLEGPPFANAPPGVHHVLARVMKDAVCRYKTMTGHYVHRKAGWTHTDSLLNIRSKSSSILQTKPNWRLTAFRTLSKSVKRTCSNISRIGNG